MNTCGIDPDASPAIATMRRVSEGFKAFQILPKVSPHKTVVRRAARLSALPICVR